MPDARFSETEDMAIGPDGSVRLRERHVFITGLELIGSIGIYEHEKRYEQRIVVSLDIRVHDTYNGRSDRIEDVYDYDLAIAAVKDTVGSGHFNLIETLAERIAERCLADRSVSEVTVRIEKPDVLLACRAVGVAITRRRG
jgi:dihydroneopterin aldolase